MTFSADVSYVDLKLHVVNDKSNNPLGMSEYKDHWADWCTHGAMAVAMTEKSLRDVRSLFKLRRTMDSVYSESSDLFSSYSVINDYSKSVDVVREVFANKFDDSRLEFEKLLAAGRRNGVTVKGPKSDAEFVGVIASSTDEVFENFCRSARGLVLDFEGPSVLYDYIDLMDGFHKSCIRELGKHGVDVPYSFDASKYSDEFKTYINDDIDRRKEHYWGKVKSENFDKYKEDVKEYMKDLRDLSFHYPTCIPSEFVDEAFSRIDEKLAVEDARNRAYKEARFSGGRTVTQIGNGFSSGNSSVSSSDRSL